ncbi:MAG: hypothetical protein IJ763_09895 [Lachnospiraceae bacterium]|nr:hypothetical protein [Lachnospiraceae bacterium]
MSVFNKKKKYYFSDDSIASDTVIAFVLGGVALIMEFSGIIASVYTKGNTPKLFAMLYMCAFLLALCGVIFAGLGFKAQEGGVKSKRWSVFLNALTLALPVVVLLLNYLNI